MPMFPNETKETILVFTPFLQNKSNLAYSNDIDFSQTIYWRNILFS